MTKLLNTLPIEEFLDRARVAIKSKHTSVVFSIKEVTDLQNSLAVVMTRLANDTGSIALPPSTTDTIEIRMNGGSF